MDLLTEKLKGKKEKKEKKEKEKEKGKKKREEEVRDTSNDPQFHLFLELPSDIQFEVFKNMDYISLGRCVSVSKYFSSVSRMKVLWKRHCFENDYIFDDQKLDAETDWYSMFVQCYTSYSVVLNNDDTTGMFEVTSAIQNALQTSFIYSRALMLAAHSIQSVSIFNGSYHDCKKISSKINKVSPSLKVTRKGRMLPYHVLIDRKSWLEISYYDNWKLFKDAAFELGFENRISTFPYIKFASQVVVVFEGKITECKAFVNKMNSTFSKMLTEKNLALFQVFRIHNYLQDSKKMKFNSILHQFETDTEKFLVGMEHIEDKIALAEEEKEF